MKSLIPKKLIKKISETDLTIKTIFGSELAVVGLDNPQRIEGAPWDGCVLDEYANMRPQAWSENVRPALSDRNGWCWFLGVPEGLNHFKDLADFAKSENVKEQGQWGFYTWPSSIVLPPEEIEAAKRDLDLKTFRQEYEASFEQAGGRVYYSYNRDINERDDLVINERQQINLCCDFNVSPCIWLIVQTLKIGKSKVVAVIDEIVLHNTNTKEMCEEFIKRYSNLMGNVVVYGDSAGSFRSTAGVMD